MTAGGTELSACRGELGLGARVKYGRAPSPGTWASEGMCVGIAGLAPCGSHTEPHALLWTRSGRSQESGPAPCLQGCGEDCVCVAHTRGWQTLMPRDTQQIFPALHNH